MKIDAKFTFLVGQEGATVEIRCDKSGLIFFRGKLDPENVLRSLGRQAYVSFQEANVYSLENIGKRLVLGELVFEIPSGLQGKKYQNPEEAKEELERLALAACPEGEKPDLYFGSKNSFFKKDGKDYARTTTRKYIEED